MYTFLEPTRLQYDKLMHPRYGKEVPVKNIVLYLIAIAVLIIVASPEGVSDFLLSIRGAPHSESLKEVIIC